MVEFIAFEADDTLWHHEVQFSEAQELCKQLIEPYLETPYNPQNLWDTHLNNQKHYGSGVKGFGLSMIESAVSVTNGRIQAKDIQQLVNLTKTMLSAPVHLLPDVAAVLDELSGDYPLFLVTKGDPRLQLSRVRRSGLGEFFRHIEVVNEKDPGAYRSLLYRFRIRPDEFLMVGNSIQSDVLPVIEVGGNAVYIPYPSLAENLETAPPNFVQLEAIGELPEWLESRLLAA